MDITAIPPTAYIAFGVITAALLTGFFSFINMVSSKENKVSEFRLVWIDGLRNEIAEYISAAQELARIKGKFNPCENHSAKEGHKLRIEWYKETRDAFKRAIENLSKIQLRLNADHIASDSNTPEAKLMTAILSARAFSIKDDLDGVLKSCEDIRSAAAPILKSTWTLVKRGEVGYRIIRLTALVTVTTGFYAIVTFGIYIGYTTYKSKTEKEEMQTEQYIKETIKNLIAPSSKMPLQNATPSSQNKELVDNSLQNDKSSSLEKNTPK